MHVSASRPGGSALRSEISRLPAIDGFVGLPYVDRNAHGDADIPAFRSPQSTTPPETSDGYADRASRMGTSRRGHPTLTLKASKAKDRPRRGRLAADGTPRLETRDIAVI